MSDNRVEMVALALCHSGKFACDGRCAPICFEFMGNKPKRCGHAARVHGDLAHTVLRTLDPSIESLQAHCAEAEMRAHQWMKAHDKLKAGKPYDLPKPADLPEAIESLQAEVGRLRSERDDARKALFQMRDVLIAVHDGLEDEGDRVYLGSSNHAELIHEAWHYADAIKWDALMEGDEALAAKEQTRD